MRGDPRLHIDAYTRAHDASVRAAEAELERSVTDETWAAMLTPLAVQAISTETPPASFPFEAADVRFQAAFIAIAGGLTRGSAVHPESTEHRVLERRLGRWLAANVPPAFATWERLCTFLSRWASKEAFILHLPIGHVESCALDIMRLPADRRTWLDSLRGVAGADAELIRELDTARLAAADTWSWLDRVERYASQTYAGDALLLRSGLLGRLSPSAWTTWVSSMPHAFYAAVAVDSLRDLDQVEELAMSCRDAAAPESDRQVIQGLLVRRALELWDTVGASLAGAATREFLSIEERNGYARQLEAWENDELPRRVGRLVDFLADASGGEADAIEVLRNLAASERRPNRRVIERRRVRDALIDLFAARDPLRTISLVLAPRPRETSLLVAARLAEHADSLEAHVEVLAAYRRWIGSDTLSWRAPLAGDQIELAAGLGASVLRMPAPVDVARGLLELAMPVSQGWCFTFERWYRGVARTAHAIMVVVLAADRARERGSTASSDALFEAAWDTMHAWLHDGPERSGADERIRHVIAFVWAHAGRFGLDARRTALALATFDDLQDAVLASRNYADNAAPSRLPLEAQRLLRGLHRAREALLARHPHVDADLLASIEEQVKELTCDV